ncbi:MAG TPA: sulfate permease [Anaerolineae bacterium]|nr:sulfate permease [Anaerolineae bacterium]
MSIWPATEEWSVGGGESKGDWTRFLPIIKTLRTYKREYVSGDMMAGLIVAIMLIPQGMAYALLAGLPPQVGLYASMLPLFIYGLLGTSRYLAVGPVAIVSLLTAASVGGMVAEGTGEYLVLALTLALMVGLIQMLMGVLKVGFLVDFLSHPVLVGFSSAAAIVIGFSQVKNLLGLSVARGESFVEQVLVVGQNLGETNLVTLGIGGGSIMVLLACKWYLEQWLRAWGVTEKWIVPITKSGPLVVVGVTTLLVWGFDGGATAGIGIVGMVPAGWPSMSWPSMSGADWGALGTTAVAISFVGYMESISVAKSLASQRREEVDANQELIALGLANVGAAFTGGYPVTGGFSRSLVNYAAGARTTLASLITAVLIALALLFLTPFFYYIPKATLAAIILVAVGGLIDLPTWRRVWGYSKLDGAALLVTFGAVLLVGIETGILLGAGTSLLLYLARTSQPHVAVVGRLPGSDYYRNVLRHEVETWPEAVLVRIDESLYFGNTRRLEEVVQGVLARQGEMRYLVLIGTAVNSVDFSALEVLERLGEVLAEVGVELHLAGFKGPVMDRLEGSAFLAHLGEGRVHLTTQAAVDALGLGGGE